MDIGGACTLLTRELARFGDLTIVEPDERRRCLPREQLGLDVRIGSAGEMPVEGPFDAITMFDVIEHIEDDLAALRAARRCSAPAGMLLLTVPALMLLWSDHDVCNHHSTLMLEPASATC